MHSPHHAHDACMHACMQKADESLWRSSSFAPVHVALCHVQGLTHASAAVGGLAQEQSPCCPYSAP